MRTIIVPTDFSENAFNALKYACQVFKYERSDIYLLHCCDPSPDELPDRDTGMVLTAARTSPYAAQKTALLEMKERMLSYAPNPHHKIISYLTRGSLPDEINDLVDQLNADAIVMGTRGASNDRRKGFGSNTIEVFKYVKCPVFAIPEQCNYTAPRQVLFPNNFLLPFRMRELKLLREMGSSFRSTVHLLYLDAPEQLSARQEEHLSFFKECLGGLRVVFETREGKDKGAAIREYIKQMDIHLLVMVNTHNRHHDSMLAPTTVEDLGLHCTVPFLVLQNLYRDQP